LMIFPLFFGGFVGVDILLKIPYNSNQSMTNPIYKKIVLTIYNYSSNKI
jgi:hypothetical protein